MESDPIDFAHVQKHRQMNAEHSALLEYLNTLL